MARIHGLRSHGWFVADDVRLHGIDADHVLVGPGGVIVVQEMWSDRGIDSRGKAPVRARIAARRLHHELAVRELPVAVVPAVLACGPGQPEVPGGVKVLDGVAYLFEDSAPEWLEDLAKSDVLDAHTLRAVREAVAELIEELVSA
jgi:hypothetical protein